MSRHADDAAVHVLNLFEMFADGKSGDVGSIVHTPARSSIPKEAAAIIGAETIADEEPEQGRVRRRTRKVMVTDDPDHADWPGLDNPLPGDEISIGSLGVAGRYFGRNYVIADNGRKYHEDAGVFTLDLVYIGLIEGTGTGVRKK